MSEPARIGTCRSAIALARLHRPAEADGVRLSEARALDPDQVGVLEVLLEVGGAAAPERGPQTGDRGGVSYPGLVLDLDRAHGREGLLDEVVLLVVERRPAEVGEPHRAIHAPALVVRVLPAGLAGGDQALGDHVHRRLELELLPLRPARAAVLDLLEAAGLHDELAGGAALRAQRPLVDRRARVALDVDQLAVAGVDDLAAADRAVGADGLRGLQPGDPRAGLLGLLRDGDGAEAPIGGAPDDRQVSDAAEAARAPPVVVAIPCHASLVSGLPRPARV